MAKTGIAVPEGLHSDYTSVIVSYSNGIDSTGALYWAIQNFGREKIILLYCDTGMDYPENIQLFYKTASFLGVRPVLLTPPKGYLELLITERLKWPDMKNRWCTAYLKTDLTDKWIRRNRATLGRMCLFVSGERRDESKSRSKLPELEYHSTTLKTKRVADFTCHWYRPCLDYEKGKMFEQGHLMKLDPHPCYEYCGRCSCMFCVFMNDQHTIENMKRYPQEALKYIEAERQIGHTWKNGKSLESVFTQCLDIDDIGIQPPQGKEENHDQHKTAPGEDRRQRTEALVYSQPALDLTGGADHEDRK